MSHSLDQARFSCGTDRPFIFNEFKMKETAKGISGHEGAGTVVAVAQDVKDLWKEGDRVGVKWVTSICQRCEFCTNGARRTTLPEAAQ